MKPRQFEELFKIFLKKQVELSICLWGTTGISKSSIPRKVARDMGYTLFDLRLSQVESVDIKGMPWTQHITVEISKEEIIRNLSKIRGFKRKAQELSQYLNCPVESITKENLAEKIKQLDEYYDKNIGVLHHYSPDWFIKALTEGRAIIFLDELNRAKPDVLQAVFELVLEKTLNNLKLGKDVHVLAACNPPTSSYEVTNMAESALIARFLHIKYESDAEQWVNWGSEYLDEEKSQTRIHPNVLNYIMQNTKMLDVKDSDEDTASLETWIGKINPKPRKWEFVSMLESIHKDILNIVIDPNNHNDSVGLSIFSECLTGLIGQEAQVAYMKQRESEDVPLTLNQILEMNEETESKLMKYCGVSDTKKRKRGEVEHLGDITIRNDLIHRNIVDVKTNLKYCLEKNPDAVAKFLAIIPKDSVAIILNEYVKLHNFAEILKTEESQAIGISQELGLKFKNALDKYPEVKTVVKEFVSITN